MPVSLISEGLHDCRRPVFFKLIESLFRGRSPRAPIHRWMSIMRQLGAESYFVEKHLTDESEKARLQREIKAIESRLATPVSWQVTKITFFRTCLDCGSSTDATATHTEDSVKGFLAQATRSGTDLTLGYCTILTVQLHEDQKAGTSYMFESVSRTFADPSATGTPGTPPHGLTRSDNFFLHARREFDGSVEGFRYRFPGNFFCQQNSITSVCAHASLAMAINNSPIDPLPAEHGLFSCEDVNLLLSVDHVRRRLALDDTTILVGQKTTHSGTHSGLFDKEMDHVLTETGFDVQRLTPLPDTPNATPLTQFIYSYIESGLPCILILSTVDPNTQHCVTVVGHTLNHHAWIPHKSRPGVIAARSCSDWVDHFIVHDDANGMQSTMPSQDFDGVGRQPSRSKLGIAVVEAVGITPRNWQIRLGGPMAEGIGLSTASSVLGYIQRTDSTYLKNLYLRRFCRALKSKGHSFAVLRTQLVRAAQYCEQLTEPDANGDSYTEASQRHLREVIEQRQLDRVWLVELTEPNLYVGNSAKVADILIDPSRSPQAPDSVDDTEFNLQAVILVRLPNICLYSKGPVVTMVPTPERKGRVPLFRSAAWTS